tara:strand:- start:9265 stop:9564 length:300 start_codon:yes stop_codon:yes gene_type:complete
MSNKPYETQDIPVKPVAIGGLVFVIIVAMTLYLLYEYTDRVVDNSIHDNKLSKRSEQLMDLQKSENDALNSYKLIDKEKQIYQIPIDRSKELLLNEKNN